MTETPKILEGEEAASALNDKEGMGKLGLVHNLVGQWAEEHRERVRAATGDRHDEGYEIDWAQECDEVMEDVDKINERKDMIAVMQNNRPVGMAGVKIIGNDPFTKRNVWEISRLSVLDEASGQKLSHSLVRAAIARVQALHPEDDILIGTGNPIVKSMCEQMKFQYISVQRLYQIMHSRIDVSEYKKEIHSKEGRSHNYLIPRTAE